MSTVTVPHPKQTAPDADRTTRFVGLMTVADYHRFDRTEPPGQRYEYEDGKVFYMPGSSLEHDRITMNLSGFLYSVLEILDDGYEVFGDGRKVYTRPGRYVYPDVTIVCGEPQADFIDALRNPCAIFEVLSEATQEEDRGSKFDEYKHIDALRHYILVDQFAVSVTHYAKNRDDNAWGEPTILTALTDILIVELADSASVSVPLARLYKRVFPATP